MDDNRIIEDIIYLTDKFYSNKDYSFYSLLKETEYLGSIDTISTEGIIYALHKHPQVIEQWLRWSENKRVNSGWYFIEKEPSTYIVGLYPKETESEPVEFLDIHTACAVFIINEIQAIRNTQLGAV